MTSRELSWSYSDARLNARSPSPPASERRPSRPSNGIELAVFGSSGADGAGAGAGAGSAAGAGAGSGAGAGAAAGASAAGAGTATGARLTESTLISRRFKSPGNPPLVGTGVNSPAVPDVP